MSVAEEIELLSEEEYLAAEESAEYKSEYVAGVVYPMAGALVGHNRVARNALGELHARLRGKTCEPFGSDMKVRIDSFKGLRFYYPDVMIDCGDAGSGEAFLTAPRVVIEVLSPSTRRTDLSEKLEAYLSISGLVAYLIVEPSEPFVREYRPVEDGEPLRKEYRSLKEVIELREIDAELPLGELYNGIEF